MESDELLATLSTLELATLLVKARENPLEAVFDRTPAHETFDALCSLVRKGLRLGRRALLVLLHLGRAPEDYYGAAYGDLSFWDRFQAVRTLDDAGLVDGATPFPALTSGGLRLVLPALQLWLALRAQEPKPVAIEAWEHR